MKPIQQLAQAKAKKGKTPPKPLGPLQTLPEGTKKREAKAYPLLPNPYSYQHRKSSARIKMVDR